MSKRDLTSAVNKAGDSAMATAEDRFASVDSLLGKVEPERAPQVAQPDKPATGRLESELQLADVAPGEETKPAAPEVEVVRKKLTVMLGESTWKDFRRACVDEGLTGQDILERLVDEYLAKRR